MQKIRSIFLDANVMISVYSFLQWAKDNRYRNYISIGKLKKRKDKQKSFEPLYYGKLYYKFLLNNKFRIVTSYLAIVETIQTYLWEKSLENMIAAKITYGKALKSAKDIAEYLTLKDFKEIGEEVDKFLEFFSERKIDLNFSSIEKEKESFVEVGKLVLYILKNFYLGTPDSFLYAIACLEQCDFFLTRDGYLRNLINSLCNGKFNKIGKNKLKPYLSGALRMDIKDIILPQGITEKEIKERIR